jgi:DNA-binding NtrC family response regulator
MRRRRPPAVSPASTEASGAYAAPPPVEPVTVLAISPFREDHESLHDIFQHSNWRLFDAEACKDGFALLRSRKIPVVITDCDVEGKGWKGVLEGIASLVLSPRPRLIVASRLANEDFWSEVLSDGGYNVLEKPFVATEVFWVVKHAWLDWKIERERQSKAASS